MDLGTLTAAVRGLPSLGRCRVMGVINVTPDSFSDGGSFADADAAVKHGLDLLAAGADLLDVGGESTRPGAEPVTAEEERRRVLPVVAMLASAGALVSIDTTRASTAQAALDAGARIVNDVSGGRRDPALLRLVAEAGVPYILMHSRGTSRDMDRLAGYRDVVAEVLAELQAAVGNAVAAGIDETSLIVDPGLGFAKTAEHNWRILANLAAFGRLGRPLLLGASRKSFLGRLLADPDGRPRPVGDRDDATAAITAIAAAQGAWGVRVHETRASADAVRVAAALRAASGATQP